MPRLSTRHWPAVLAFAAAAALAGPQARADGSEGANTTASTPDAAGCASCGVGRQTVYDARAVFTAPARWQKPEWRSAARKAVIVAGAMALLDGPVRDSVQSRRNASSNRLADAFEPFGERYAAGVLLGYWLAGRSDDRPVARQIAVDGLESEIIAAGLVTPALKLVTGRSRPRTDLGASDFHPFNGGESFPSGHTTAAFALAASIAAHDDRKWVKGLAYGVASLVGYARIVHDAHFVSDVTAGAFIGIGVAKRVAKLNAGGRGLSVVPLRQQQGFGIAIAKRF